MPPRRSSRSRASVEPTPRLEVPKRKRGSQVADAHLEEKENHAAPRSRTRSKAALPQVPESDEDDDVPTNKKLRPSLAGEESEIEEIKPKVTRGGSRRPQRASSRTVSGASRKTRSSNQGDDVSAPIVILSDDEEEAPPARKTRKGSVKPEPSPPSVRISSPGPPSDAQMEASDGDVDGSKGGDDAPSAKDISSPPASLKLESTPRKKVSSPSSSNQQQSAEEDEEESLLEPPPISKPVPQPQVVVEEPDVPQSRLVIYKLALVNFKSYAGRQVIGPFHKSFSAIVGPNGSGKSNTIDALLFVFGYRATKMRQAKLSELIHNSDLHPDLSECSVEVYFREIIDLPGPDAFEIVPGSQLVVARHATKANTSRYTINGRGSSYTEVQTLLKGRGIDLDHKRFLILQGEVESIAQMKPKGTEHDDGLLEYLEDIIGTSKYKEPIEHAQIEVERLQEERGEKLNRLRIVEKEKNALEAKRQEALNYLRLQNDWVRARSCLLQYSLWKCLLGDHEMSHSLSKHKNDLSELVERNKDDIAHYNLLTEHYQERERTYEVVRAAAAEAMKDLAKQEKDEVGLSERRKHAAAKAKKLKKSLQEDESGRIDAERSLKENTDKKARAEAKLEEHEQNLASEEKELERIQDSLRDKTQVFYDQIEVKQKELQPWKAKINSKQAEIDVANGERDALVRKAEELKQAYREAEGTLEQLQTQQAAKEQEIHAVKKQKSDSEQRLLNYKRTVQDMQGKVEELRKQSASSRSRVDEARAKQAANTSQNRVLDGLSRLAAQGRIAGFHGRLGSLGTIDDKYDVAISTACSSLNNMVVDTVDQGQACIDYLRSQNLGRASFIVLEKVPSVPGMQKFQTPENVPRLFDLVKPKEPRFAAAFYKVLKDTLVANDLNQANRIAYGSKRFRVVTLDGGLIDLSGTMSGGGNHKTKGLMSSKFAAETVRPETLRQYEKDSEEAARQFDAAVEELRNAESELEKAQAMIPRLTTDLEKLEMDVANGRRKMADAEKRLRDLKAQCRPDAGDLSRIKKLDEEIASSTAELESLEEKSNKFELAIQELQKKIIEIGGSRLLAQKSKVDGLKLHINLANEDITKAEVNMNKASKDLKRHETSLVSNTAALEDVEKDLAQLDQELAELRELVQEYKKKVEESQTAAENSKEDLESLKAELDQKEEQIQAFKQQKMEIEQQITTLQRELKDNSDLMAKYQQEHEELQLEDIDDDDDEDEGEDEDAPGGDAEAAEDDEQPEVKNEPGQEPEPKRNKRARTSSPSNELHIYSEPELQKFKYRQLRAETELLDEKVKNAKPNMGALEEYRRREEEYFRRAKDLDNTTAQRDDQKRQYDGLCKQRLDEFMTGFNLISLKLKEMYQMITLGGNAELELVDSMDPFSEGIIFSVMPPKKSWKNISNLSGGEKTLSSLALVFALHVFKPTPLYFMDEIDAALDFRNVSIVANYIKDRTKNAQFIIISLRNDMFELSHRLIGIYKTSNATRSISIDNHTLAAPPTMAAPTRVVNEA